MSAVGIVSESFLVKCVCLNEGHGEERCWSLSYWVVGHCRGALVSLGSACRRKQSSADSVGLLPAVLGCVKAGWLSVSTEELALSWLSQNALGLGKGLGQPAELCFQEKAEMLPERRSLGCSSLRSSSILSVMCFC